MVGLSTPFIVIVQSNRARPLHTLNETGFETAKFQPENLVGGFIKQRFGSRQRSLSFLSFLPRYERPLLAGKESI